MQKIVDGCAQIQMREEVARANVVAGGSWSNALLSVILVGSLEAVVSDS